MPIYGYECKDCGVRFERRQSFSDDPVTVCPECRGEVHRLVQPAGIIFKGSGFYINDSRASKKNLTGTGKRDSESKKTESESGSSSNSDD